MLRMMRGAGKKEEKTNSGREIRAGWGRTEEVLARGRTEKEIELCVTKARKVQVSRPWVWGRSDRYNPGGVRQARKPKLGQLEVRAGSWAAGAVQGGKRTAEAAAARTCVVRGFVSYVY